MAEAVEQQTVEMQQVEEEMIETPTKNKDKNLLSKTAAKVLSNELAKLVSQKLEQVKTELVAELKETFTLAMDQPKKKVTKSVVRKAPTTISMERIHKVFREKYMSGIQKPEINLTHLVSTLQASCFEDDTLMVSDEVFTALNLNKIEKKIMKTVSASEDENMAKLLIHMDEKTILLNKIVETNTVVEVEGNKLDISSPDIIDQLVDLKYLTKSDTDDSFIIKSVFHEVLSKTLKSKSVDPMNCTKSKLIESFNSITKKSTMIYCQIKTECVDILEQFKIPYVTIDSAVYTKNSFFKGVKFTKEEQDYFKKRFNDYSVKDSNTFEPLLPLIKIQVI